VSEGVSTDPSSRQQHTATTPVLAQPLSRRIALANLVAQVGIVVTGGLVRLTGSGLGCPTWPQCIPGSYTPVVHQAQGYHKDIEFGNRLLTFVLIALVVAVVIVARRESARRGGDRRLVLLGWVPAIGVLAQIVIGGVTVLLALNPISVSLHFLPSILLIAGSTAFLLALGEPVAWAQRPRREVELLADGMAIVVGLVLIMGTIVTGSGPHSGDAQHASRLGFDPRTVSWIHADLVWLFIGLVIALVFALRIVDAPRRVWQRVHWVAIIAVLQGLVGYIQYATGLPIWLVALHMLGSACLAVAVTATWLAVHDGRSAPAGSSLASDARSAATTG